MADNHKSPLRPEGDDLLAALSDPFSVPNLPRVSPFQSTNPTAPPVSTDTAAPPEPPSDPTLSPTATSPESSVSPAEFDAWRVEYDSQVTEWRRQSATVRARAEEERARWEERRAHEQQRQEDTGDDGRQQPASASTSDWEAVSHSTPTAAPPAAPAPPQSNLAPPSSAHRSPAAAAAAAAAPVAVAAAADPTGSPNWVNVPSSPTSSFPSMSFPEPSRPHSPEHSHAPRATAAPPSMVAASATLAVFDDTLPRGKRVWALITSLSVNMFLPFVNGVMLGFGEIFAKTVVVGWLGWGPAVATNVGLGVSSTSRRQWL